MACFVRLLNWLVSHHFASPVYVVWWAAAMTIYLLSHLSHIIFIIPWEMPQASNQFNLGISIPFWFQWRLTAYSEPATSLLSNDRRSDGCWLRATNSNVHASKCHKNVSHLFSGQRISNSLSLTLSSRPVSIWLLSYAMNIPGTFGTYSSSPELGHIFWSKLNALIVAII